MNKLNTNFHFEHPIQENGVTFWEVPLLPEIFPLSEPKSLVLACSRRSDSAARAKKKASKRAGKKQGETREEDEGTPVKLILKKPMPPTLDRRQRQRNMNPGWGQSKQES